VTLCAFDLVLLTRVTNKRNPATDSCANKQDKAPDPSDISDIFFRVAVRHLVAHRAHGSCGLLMDRGWVGGLGLVVVVRLGVQAVVGIGGESGVGVVGVGVVGVSGHCLVDRI